MFILQNIQDGSYFGAKSFYIKSEFKSVAAAKAAMTRYAKKHADVFDPNNFVITDLNTYVSHKLLELRFYLVLVKKELTQLVSIV